MIIKGHWSICHVPLEKYTLGDPAKHGHVAFTLNGVKGVAVSKRAPWITAFSIGEYEWAKMIENQEATYGKLNHEVIPGTTDAAFSRQKDTLHSQFEALYASQLGKLGDTAPGSWEDMMVDRISRRVEQRIQKGGTTTDTKDKATVDDDVGSISGRAFFKQPRQRDDDDKKAEEGEESSGDSGSACESASEDWDNGGATAIFATGGGGASGAIPAKAKNKKTKGQKEKEKAKKVGGGKPVRGGGMIVLAPVASEMLV